MKTKEEVLKLLINFVQKVDHAMYDSEELRDGRTAIDLTHSENIQDALEYFETELDPEPGYVESPANNIKYFFSKEENK